MTTKEIQAAILKSCVHAYQGIKIRAANGVKVRTIKAGQLIGALTAEVFELIKCLSFGQNELVGGNADNDATQKRDLNNADVSYQSFAMIRESFSTRCHLALFIWLFGGLVTVVTANCLRLPEVSSQNADRSWRWRCVRAGCVAGSLVGSNTVR